ncbi:ankyrin repeat, PH and SEC7 domain containing protein secG-like [Trichogramma pretiosum]|uniref:ankyrin repeat, PH and SEC7 domain containing protein secG-like n=1 Tax=Trichogramma pretiosum TaxID=7493 RepID=UPI0006C9BF1C|nr:ankyrin repeat, PH and SEC7 domain containing protein secG-like [Trichogramma pretiosum]
MAYSSEEGIVKKIKKLKEHVVWPAYKERSGFLSKIIPMVKEWKHSLPNLEEIFSNEEIGVLLIDAINISVNDERFDTIDSCVNFVKFIARCGYIDESEEHKYKHRFTPVHDSIQLLRKLDSFESDRESNVVETMGRGVRHRCQLSERRDPVQRRKELYEHYSDFVNDLLNMFPRFDINYSDSEGLTHLHVASAFGCYYVVEQFLEHGHDPNKCVWEKTGDTPLHLAIRYGHLDVVQLLLDSGADTKAINKNGSRPVHELCKSIHGEDLVGLLFIIGDEMDTQDVSGNSPLHLAATTSHKKVIRYLLKKGANWNLANSDGETSLHAICRNKDEEIAKLFLKSAKQQMRMGIDAQD